MRSAALALLAVLAPSGCHRLDPRDNPPDGAVDDLAATDDADAASATAGYVQVAAGGAYTCAITRSGEVDCWGSNGNGQLGLTPGGGSVTPNRVPNVANATAIVAGLAHACAVAGGQLICWGANNFGQLGTGSSAGTGPPTAVAFPTDAGGGTIVAAAAGYYSTCAIDSTAAVWCWGRDEFGQIGAPPAVTTSLCPATLDGGFVACQPTPVRVRNIAAQTLALGGYFSCAITADAGSIQCWGLNQYGQFGNGRQSNAVDPDPMAVYGSPPIAFAAVAANNATTCAIARTGGVVACWGSNGFGQAAVPPDSVGQPVPAVQLVPFFDGGVRGAISVSVGVDHACAIAQGAVSCWGQNTLGQLGRPTAPMYCGPDAAAACNVTPTTVPFDAGTGQAIQVSAGQFHSCAVIDDGTLWCWGWNYNGQLGIGRTNGFDAGVAPFHVLPPS